MNIFSEPEWAAIFGVFLSPKGKVLFDSLIIKPQHNEKFTFSEIEYLLDVDRNDTNNLILHLKKYAFR